MLSKERGSEKKQRGRETTMEELAFDARRVMRDARGVRFRHRGCEGEDKEKEQETHRGPEKIRLVRVFSCGRARSAWKRLCVGRCLKRTCSVCGALCALLAVQSAWCLV